MKKVFALLAITSLMVACGGSAETKPATTDSPAAVTADTSKPAAPVADTTAHAADSSAAKK